MKRNVPMIVVYVVLFASMLMLGVVAGLNRSKPLTIAEYRAILKKADEATAWAGQPAKAYVPLLKDILRRIP